MNRLTERQKRSLLLAALPPVLALWQDKRQMVSIPGLTLGMESPERPPADYDPFADDGDNERYIERPTLDLYGPERFVHEYPESGIYYGSEYEERFAEFVQDVLSVLASCGIDADEDITPYGARIFWTDPAPSVHGAGNLQEVAR